jgi:post-segregation antitoxin (ccd killing protein)
MRMARVNISLPDQLLNHAKGAGLNISQVAAKAIAEELNRRSKMAGLRAYLEELDAELGPISAEEAAQAAEWADRVLGPAPEKSHAKRSA